MSGIKRLKGWSIVVPQINERLGWARTKSVKKRKILNGGIEGSENFGSIEFT
jgi:hypothetical protein